MRVCEALQATNGLWMTRFTATIAGHSLNLCEALRIGATGFIGLWPFPAQLEVLALLVVG